MKHKVMDLARAVEEIPPSNPQVVLTFIKKLEPQALNGEVESFDVRKVVNEWPNGCKDGRERFLRKVGAEEHQNDTVMFATVGFAAVGSNTYSTYSTTVEHWYRWNGTKEGAGSNAMDKFLAACSHMEKGETRDLVAKGGSHSRIEVGIQHNVTIDLKKAGDLTLDRVITDDEGQRWLVFKTEHRWDGTTGTLHLVVPMEV